MDFLEEIDKELEKRITLVAVGGTALTLLGAKPSTIDVDLTLPPDDYDEFQRALARVPVGFDVHCFQGSMIFSQDLPDDYLDKKPSCEDQDEKYRTQNVESFGYRSHKNRTPRPTGQRRHSGLHQKIRSDQRAGCRKSKAGFLCWKRREL